MISALFTLALLPANAQTWEPQTIELNDTLRGETIVRSESGGWILRTAGAQSGYGRGASKGRPSRSRGPSMAPSMDFESAGEMDSEPMEFEEMAVADGSGASLQAAPMKAGTTDDNQHFGEFLEFVATWKGKPGAAGNHVEIDVAKRSGIKVRGADGSPLPGARVTVSHGKRTVWSGTTYGNGHAPFYPGLLEGPQTDYRVDVVFDGVSANTRWDGGDPVALTLDAEVASVVDLDVVFVIDTTGSMSDEIDRVKQTLLSVTAKVQELETPVNLRYGAVLYRDIGDEYLTKHTALTTDLKGFDEKLQGIRAKGGGDGPESYNQGLAVAVGEMDWRENAAKLVFLVADAPPHMDYESDLTYAEVSQSALAHGIRIHTVAASGLPDFGSLVFRQTAQLTQGQFIFIEYGSTAASAADHGVTGPVHSNNLDDILLRQISREIEGWGQPLVAMK